MKDITDLKEEKAFRSRPVTVGVKNMVNSTVNLFIDEYAKTTNALPTLEMIANKIRSIKTDSL